MYRQRILAAHFSLEAIKRAAIQASTEPASALAARFGTTEQTVYKYKLS